MRRAAVIAGTYAVVGSAWVVGSDVLLTGSDALDGVHLAALAKGASFVLVTSLTLFVALLGLYGRQKRLARSLAAAARVEEAERRRRELAGTLFSRVVEATADGVWIFDAAHRLLTANNAGWAALGRPPSAEPVALADSGWSAEHQATLAGLIDTAINAARTSRGRARYEVDGRPCTVDYVVNPIADPETEERRALLVAHDVTELLEAEAARQRTNRILRAVVASLSAINRTRDRKALAEAVCRALQEEAGFGAVWIGFPTGEEALPLAPVAVAGAAVEDLRRLVGAAASLSPTACPPLTAWRTGTVAVRDDVATDPDYAPMRQMVVETGFRTAVAFPLIASGNVIAVLAIYERVVTRFGEEELAPLAILAENLAYAFTSLDSLVRYEESEAGRLAAMSRVKEVLIETIGALAGVVEIRDPYTAGHQRRVAALATAIARRKGWSEDRIEGLRLGALIHDIGKISVPAELLVKPGRLTEEEFALIRTHAERGGTMIRDLPFDWPIHEMVTQHHERLDGSGYPGKLRDNEIAPEAKVIAVADVADAMLWNRPYRASKRIEDVVAELSTGRGIRYEREAVDICLELLAERGLDVFEGPDGADASRPAA